MWDFQPLLGYSNLCTSCKDYFNPVIDSIKKPYDGEMRFMKAKQNIVYITISPLRP